MSVLNAQIIGQVQRLVTELQAELHGRAVIDQAIGVLRSRTGATVEEASNSLRLLGHHQHIEIATLAGRIVDEATVRAIARRNHP